jgi:hypothetical protein
LRSTAEAVSDHGQDNSFKPEGEFTKEVFNRIRKSTYIIRYLTKTNELYMETGWSAKKRENNLYLISATHGTFEDKEDIISGIEVIRPGIDEKIITPTDWNMVSDRNLDATVIKCTLKPENAENIETISYMDNYAIESGQQVLTVSYPEEFINPTNIAESLTKGEIMQVINRGLITNDWYTTGLTTNAQSGSPVVIVGENNEPVVIGMLIASAENFSLNSENGVRIVKKSEGVIQTLSLEKLFNRIE